MSILSLNIFLFTIFGVWKPAHWKSTPTIWIYNAYTVIITLMLHFLTFTQCMDVLLLVNDIDEFTANCFMLISILGVCWKAVIVLIKRQEIIRLMDSLLEEPCKPRDDHEAAIFAQFETFIRTYTKRYSFLTTMSVTGVTIRSILSVADGSLPFRVWLPYSTPPHSFVFWLTAFQQIIATVYAAYISVGTETLIFGLILHTCSQIEILKHRLQQLTVAFEKYHNNVELLPYELQMKVKDGLSRCVDYHIVIFEYAEDLNSVFSPVLFVQFSGSVIILCCSIFQISALKPASMEFLGLLVYTICMLAQIFLYCWSGNEVMLKCGEVSDAVYAIDWTILGVSERRMLLVIMKRSMTPIKFTSSFLVSLTINSYTSILKATYSAFNVLQQSMNK
ncbi:odorant receptor 10-like [Prorops nasuta]|uniref:odorant receptor 10-like n=1 Tax=Prorops nasuta TaxID=863751 RepID=UPI0034CE459D